MYTIILLITIIFLLILCINTSLFTEPWLDWSHQQQYNIYDEEYLRPAGIYG